MPRSTSLTVMVMVSVSVGTPSSHGDGGRVIRQVPALRWSPGEGTGVGSMAMPAVGASSSEKVKVLAGRSASVAVAVKASSTSSSTVWLPIAPSTGAMFTSLTVTLMVSVSVSAAVGTVMVTGVDAGPCVFGGRPGEGTGIRVNGHPDASGARIEARKSRCWPADPHPWRWR